MLRYTVCVGYVAAYFLTSVAQATPTRISVSRYANCFEMAAATYGIDAGLLTAIAMAESSMRPTVKNLDHIARTGTYDIGLMQINSGWLPSLKRFNISEDELNQPCTNISVGAWILRRLIDKHGETWNSVGAYNAACTQLKGPDCDAARVKYVRRVHRFLNLKQRTASTTNANDVGRVPPSHVPVGALATAAPQPSAPDAIEVWSNSIEQKSDQALE